MPLAMARAIDVMFIQYLPEEDFELLPVSPP